MCQCLGQLWETAKYPLSCSLTPPPQWGRERKQDEKSPWLDKDREIAYQLLLWEKQTRLGENSFTLWRIKQIQVVRTPPPPTPFPMCSMKSFTPDSSTPLHPQSGAAAVREGGLNGQYTVAPLYRSFSLTLSHFPIMGSPHGLQSFRNLPVWCFPPFLNQALVSE